MKVLKKKSQIWNNLVIYNAIVILSTIFLASLSYYNIMGGWYVPILLSFTVISNMVTWIVTLYVWTVTKNTKEQINDLTKSVEDKLRDFGLTVDFIIKGFKDIELTDDDMKNITNTITIFKKISNELKDVDISEDDITKYIKIIKQSKNDKLEWNQ